MPSVGLYNIEGKEVGKIDLNETIFGVTEISKPLLHQVVVNYLANQRQGTQSTKTRGEVRGGGKKPWKQKGTGRARQGSIRASQWVHGGVALGPKPRSFKYTLPRMLKRVALRHALSSKVLENSLVVVENLDVNEFKTKTVVNILSKLNLNGKVELEKTVESAKGNKPKFREERILIVLPQPEEKLVRSAQNISTVGVSYTNTLNVYDILYYDKVLITKEAVNKVEEVYA
jgi:large subunit ribosomal protein L4